MLLKIKKYGLILVLFLILPIIYIVQAQLVYSHEDYLAISVKNLDINIQADSAGNLNVSEVFSFNPESDQPFSWQINSKKVDGLKIYQGHQELSPSDYQVSQNQGQTIISGLISSWPSEVWRIEYREKGNFISKKENIEWRYQPIKNNGLDINHLNVLVSFPKELDRQSTIQNLYAVHGVENPQFSFASNTLIYSGDNLWPYSSFSCTANLAKNMIQIPLSARIISSLNLAGLDFWIIISITFPLITSLMILIMVYIIRKREHIVVPKEILSAPPIQMSPILVGVLFRQKISAREIAAEIIDLALKGYVVITEKNYGYSLGERKSLADLDSYDRALTDELLKGHLRETLMSLKEQPQKELFSIAVTNIYNRSYDEVARLNYFVLNPRIVFLKYRIFGIITFFLSALAFFITPRFIDPPYLTFAFLGAALASLIIIDISGLMPQRTKQGQIVLQKWLSFRKFLIEYSDVTAPTEVYREKFIEYLPYAVALDCEKEWANHFTKIPFHVPDWYLSYAAISNLPEFTTRLYPLIDGITKTILALKEPIL